MFLTVQILCYALLATQTTTTTTKQQQKNNIQNDEHLPQQEPVQVSKVDQVESTPSAASEHSSRQDDFVH
jgi:hypothetical protein